MSYDLILGLGGFGGRLASSQEGRCPVFELDRVIERNRPNERQLSLWRGETVGELLAAVPAAGEWFPQEPCYRCKTLPGEQLCLRATGRLMLEYAWLCGRLAPLAAALEGLSAQRQAPLQVAVVTSLAGSFGSGAFAALARVLAERFPTIRLYGVFLMPEPLERVCPTPLECSTLRAHTCAALKELQRENPFEGCTFYCTEESLKAALAASPRGEELPDFARYDVDYRHARHPLHTQGDF